MISGVATAVRLRRLGLRLHFIIYLTARMYWGARFVWNANLNEGSTNA